MTPTDPTQFEQCALASGLASASQLAEARHSLGRAAQNADPSTSAPGERRLAERLIEMGVLNPWQAQQLLDGRTKFSLGPYDIIDSIGQGGMGQIFKARHQDSGQVVAVKVLPREKSTPQAVANFQREIRALASLHHIRLVRALDAGSEGNVHYLVTEYIPGMDLRKLVRQRGPLGMSLAAAIVRQVAEGLEYAHHKGIVHRDVKPGNVLVTPHGQAKLSDLGLASPLDCAAESDPRYGKIVGTADYLSPDQIRDPWHPTPAWDIYSLGCTLYYAVTGRVPFPGGTTREKVRAHCEQRPVDPRRINPQLSAPFVETLAALMAKEPTRRIATAHEVQDRLNPFILPDAGRLPAVPLPPLEGAAATAPAPPPVVRLPWTEDDQSSSLEMQIAVRKDRPGLLVPLLVFILTPVVIVGGALLLRWLARTVF